MDEKVVKIIKPFREGQAEAVALGDSSLRYEYTKPDGTKGTFGSVRKVFRCINEREEYGASTKFKVGLTIFAPGEGGPVHVHENSEEFSYIIQGSGVQLDRGWEYRRDLPVGGRQICPGRSISRRLLYLG